jgi:pilus assembly protein Flp/PilA
MFDSALFQFESRPATKRLPLWASFGDQIKSGLIASVAYRPRMKTLPAFLADESGATAIEYGLIAAGISLAIIAVVNGLGTKLNTKFTSLNTSLK